MFQCCSLLNLLPEQKHLNLIGIASITMEWLSGPGTSSGCPAARKKRSDILRRPHPNPKPFINFHNVHTLEHSPTDYRGHGDINSCHLDVHSTDNVGYDENHQDKFRGSLHESGHLGNENKLKKVKLKLGGITRTLQTKSPSGIAPGSGQVKDLSRMYYDSAAMNETSKDELVHKSKRVPKKRAVDEGFDDEDDEEIRYLKKLRASKAFSVTRDYGSPGLGKDGRKKGRMCEDNDYEVELMSDDDVTTKRSLVENLVNPLVGSGQEMTITTRKRALECTESGIAVEFPNGLPAAPPKKQKLSEVEQQLRKAEAAQRRRLQAEKASKEAEAEAIRRILGQDSNRKKKEEKLKKQQEQLAQDKIDKAATLGPNTIRWIMGPHGTIVTFSDDIGLPKIFDSQSNRYPPPREKCVGPNCTNEYKYRDSKSKLPLCSLHCYKAVQGNMEPLPAC